MKKNLPEMRIKQMKKEKFNIAYKNGIYRELYQRKLLSKEELNRLLNSNR